MLTGESVPVSKAPITDPTLRKMNLSNSGIPAEISKHFLFMGTKMVRVRGGDNVSAATAIVVRTGFSTAKGALVRSMLFPKPNSFKFYRDSFRFIGVLSVIGKVKKEKEGEDDKEEGKKKKSNTLRGNRNTNNNNF
jgi:cation-transporting ATPase 13A3/4/5